MFFSDIVGVEFEAFGFVHILFFIITIGVGLLIFFKREWIRNHPKERWIAISIATVALALEIGLYIWTIAHGRWTWDGGFPFFSLCGMTLYLGIAATYFKSYKLFEIGYFWTWGAIASVLFPDIPYSFDRFRFYQFMLGHMMFFFLFLYMIFVYRWRPTWRSFQKSVLTLFVIAVFYTVLSNLTNTNLMFMAESEGTPLSMFEGGAYIWYLIGTVGLSFAVMAVWMLPFHFTASKSNK